MKIEELAYMFCAIVTEEWSSRHEVPVCAKRHTRHSCNGNDVLEDAWKSLAGSTAGVVGTASGRRRGTRTMRSGCTCSIMLCLMLRCL